MDSNTKTLEAKCFCGGVHFTVDIPQSSLPLRVRFCHCSLCRSITGAPFIVHADLPKGVQPSFISPSSAANITDYVLPGSTLSLGFCSGCGCHVNAIDTQDPDDEYTIASSMFTGHSPENFKIAFSAFTKSAKDGGCASLLIPLEERGMKIWNPPEDDARAKVVEYEPEVGDDGQDRLRAQCHCGGVSFALKRPSKDLIHDKSVSSCVSSSDGNKWVATLDVGDDSRLVTGTHVIGWVSIPPSFCEPPIGHDLKIGTAKTHVSPSGDTRSFCGTCGATVLYKDGEKGSSDAGSAVRVATGILRAPEGVMARNWLTWETDITGLDSGKRFDADFAESLETGLTRWASDTNSKK